MKQIKLIIISILINPFFFYAQNAGDTFFNSSVVHDISITFLDPDWSDSLTQYKWYSDNLDSNVYLPASVTIDGTVLDSVGVRYKGNSSYYNYPTTKKPLKLDFNEFISGQVFDGLKKMNLNNLYQDPTFMREKLFLDFIKSQGLYGPRASYSRVFINGNYWGLYLSVDQIDKTFLQWNYGNKNGNLFKGDNSTSACADLDLHGNLQSYYNCYELKTNETTNDWSDLVNLTTQINATSNLVFRDSLEIVMNTNSFIGSWACYNLLCNFDSYPYRFTHNYYTYHNTFTDKFEWIIWDVSTAFGLDIPWTIPQVEQASFYYIWPTDTDRPLTYRMLQDSVYKQAYTDFMCQYINDFNPTVQFPIIDSLYNAIKTDVYADTLKMYTNQQFENNILNTTSIGGFDVPGLKSFISNRFNNVLNELSTLNCTVTGVDNVIESHNNRVTIYPNPFTNYTLVEYTGVDTKWNWTLYNSLGQIVQQVKNISNQKLIIHKGDLTNGIYMYHIQTTDKLDASGKLIIK